MNTVGVFCGSSLGNDATISSAALALGETLARQQITLVYGAAKIGVMGQIAQSCLDHGGEVIGVIPHFLKLKEVVHTDLTQVITTQTMHERKEKMYQLSDGLIALPGGFGTLDELFEALTWSQLGLHQKPIGILNQEGYFNELLRFITTMTNKGFLKSENQDLLIVDDNVNTLLSKMKNYEPKPVPKWLMANR